MSDMAERATVLERACGVLVRLVRDEYPDHYTLAQIARIFAGASDEETQALEVLEAERK